MRSAALVRARRRRRRRARAPANIFVLLSWCSALYSTLLRSDPAYPTTPGWTPLVASLAVLLDLQLTQSTRTKPSMRSAALVRARRALRTSPEALPVLMGTLVAQAKASQGPAGLVQIPLQGTAVDISLRLKTADERLRTISEENKNNILALYTSVVVMTKTPVPPHASGMLHDFIQRAVTLADLENTVLRALEKALSVVNDFLTVYTHPLSRPSSPKTSRRRSPPPNPQTRSPARGHPHSQALRGRRFLCTDARPVPSLLGVATAPA